MLVYDGGGGGGFRSFSVLHKYSVLFNIIYGNLFINAIERKKDDTDL